MSKTVTIKVDSTRGRLSVKSGRLLLGADVPVVLTGDWKADGDIGVLTVYAPSLERGQDEELVPVAQAESGSDGSTFSLSLRGARLRRLFRDPVAHCLPFYLNRRRADGTWYADVEARGLLWIQWNPQVYEIDENEPATMRGPKGTDGVDGRDGKDAVRPDIPMLGDDSTLREVRSYVKRLAASTCTVVGALALTVAPCARGGGISVQGVALDDMPPSAIVVTNVTLDTDGLVGGVSSVCGQTGDIDITFNPTAFTIGTFEYNPDIHGIELSYLYSSGNLSVHEKGVASGVISSLRRTLKIPGIASTNDLCGFVKTKTDSTSETRMRNIPSAPAMSIVPEGSLNTLPVNRWRVVRIGDDETVTSLTDAEARRLLLPSPRDLYFIDRVEIDGSTTNYVLKSFQSYLDAVSPDAVGDLIGNYLPTNGGGTVTGEVKVLGNLFVSGGVSMPNLVDVRTANIIANGFVVSNRVVVAESGLMVSNGVCHINGAIANGTIQATRVHIMDGGDVTFGGSPENPTAGMRGMIEGLTLAKITELGFTGNPEAQIGQTEGMYPDGTRDRFARLSDLVAHTSQNCVRPIGDQTTSGGSRASITLRNWCLNVPTESLSVTKELRVFYPLHEIKDHLDMTQRLSFGIYFPMAPAATVSVKWDYAPDDGGFELRGETGEELDSISAGDYIWFQQIGPNVLSVTKRNVSNTIHPLVNE